MQGLGNMSNVKCRHFGLGLLIIVAGLIWGAAPAVGSVADNAAAPDTTQADVIIIDGLSIFGPLERPAVGFRHDKHTNALAKQNKDCLACHQMVSDRLALTFGRTETTDKQTVMDIYHDRCISCHKETIDAGNPGGPVTCGQCHVEDTPLQPSRKPIRMDTSLHYRHVKATEKKCETCHHEYNAETKKLFYAKGQEGACFYCHKDQAEENRIANRSAAHLACVGCHRQKAAQKQDAGPIQCAGCHDSAQQALIEKLSDVPRLERNQPDAVLVKTHGTDQNPAPAPTRMGVVPFDHKAHEGYNDSCMVCHHADLKSCAACHTVEGTSDGRQVKLAQAMHQQDATMSCIGCHNQKTTEPQCIGCHQSIPRGRTLTSAAACRTCHMDVELENPVTPAGMDAAQSAALAAELLSARQPMRQTIPADQIPETVTIKNLTDQYKEVVLPHRKMVLTLAQVNETSNLAAYYHSDPLTICQGCHHNSPASLKPPQCGSCHGRSSEALNLTRPGLMAAYHQQCITCHDSMGLEKPASRECTACHAKRN
jgi:hypothetical protein